MKTFAVLAIICVIVWTLLPDSWTDKTKYSMEYSISSDQVQRSDRPTDCDWDHAPLGGKGCHYKKTVSAYNSKGELVAGDDAPIYGNDGSTGRPIVSYDNRKTWQWLREGQSLPDLGVKEVEIVWSKVEE